MEPLADFVAYCNLSLISQSGEELPEYVAADVAFPFTKRKGIMRDKQELVYMFKKKNDNSKRKFTYI